jgi:hypothetical protein
MRLMMLAAGLLAAMLSAAQAAPNFEDPRGLIEYAYAPYTSSSTDFPDPTELYSPTLKQLWDDMAAKSEEADMPIIDFDPLINAQDYEITDLIIADPALDGDNATVAVSFSNFGEPQELHFELVKRVDGWKIDDIESVGAYAWRLSELLAADPMLN